MGRNSYYLETKIRAFCERFHPHESPVNFRDYTFNIYMDGTLYVSRRIPPATVCVMLEIECDGSVVNHDPDGILYTDLLPHLEQALVLDSLADV